MKIVPTLLAVLALGLAVRPAAAQEPRVAVVFANPERYADLKLTCVSGDADARALMGELARFVQEAGDIESWRGPGRCDLRIMKDVYPPRIDLQFRLLGADGAEARAGTRRLRDRNDLTGAALRKDLRAATGS